MIIPRFKLLGDYNYTPIILHIVLIIPRFKLLGDYNSLSASSGWAVDYTTIQIARGL